MRVKKPVAHWLMELLLNLPSKMTDAGTPSELQIASFPNLINCSRSPRDCGWSAFGTRDWLSGRAKSRGGTSGAAGGGADEAAGLPPRLWVRSRFTSPANATTICSCFWRSTLCSSVVCCCKSRDSESKKSEAWSIPAAPPCCFLPMLCVTSVGCARVVSAVTARLFNVSIRLRRL